jgi:hypothetical protein
MAGRGGRRRRAKTSIEGQDFFVGHLKPWPGTVVRRDPASYQRRSIVMTWICRRCRTWTMNGAYKIGRCNWCDEARAADQ